MSSGISGESDTHNTCRWQALGEHAEARGTVSSKWEDGLNAGYKQALNPQIAVEFVDDTCSHQANFTLTVPDSDGVDGIALFVYQAKTSTRFWSVKDNSDNLIASSDFVRSKTISTSLNLKQLSSSKTCIVLICCENKSSTSNFKLDVQFEQDFADEKLPLLRVLCAQRVSIDSWWTKDLCGGYDSATNPQFLLSTTTPNNVYIELRVKQNTRGIAWMLYDRGEARGRILLNSADALLAKSPFRSGSTHVSATASILECTNSVIEACIESIQGDKQSLTMMVTMELSEHTKSELSLRPLPCVRSIVTGEWTAQTSNGPQSMCSPQIALDVSASASAKTALVTLRRHTTHTETSDVCGIKFRVFGLSRTKQVMRVLAEPQEDDEDIRMIAKSRYIIDSEVSCVLELNSLYSTYVIVPSLEHHGVLDEFSVCVELDCGDEAPALQILHTTHVHSIEGVWSEFESAGVTSMHNPQFFVKARKGCTELAFELRRTDSSQREGIRIIVYSVNEAKRLLGDDSEAALIAKSVFIKSSFVSLMIPVTEHRRFVVVCALGLGNKTGKFIFTTQTHCSHKPPQVEKLAVPKAMKFSAEWKGSSSAGYKQAANPQWQLCCDTDTWMSVELCVPTNEGKNAKGICLALYRGVKNRFGQRRRNLSDTDLVALSKFVAGSHTQLNVPNLVVDEDTPFIVVAFTEKSGVKGEDKFELVVRSGYSLTMKLLPQHSEATQLSESKCLSVLAKMNALHPETNGVNKKAYHRSCKLYEKNPLDAIEKYCRKHKCMFVDKEFPASSRSLNRSKKGGIGLVKANDWRRFSAMRDEPRIFCGKIGTAIDPNDVIQGSVGDCWLLQAVSSIAQRGDILQHMLHPQQGYSECGAYALRLYDKQADVWRFLLLDDYIPVNKHGKLTFARSRDPDEMWVSLIEKAFAKLHSCYQYTKGSSPFSMNVGNALEYMTSGNSIDIHIENTAIDDLWSALCEHLDSGWLAGCGSRAAKQPHKNGQPNSFGIVPMHAYSILNWCVVKRHNTDTRLLRLRNTWGNTEWTGRWSDKSRHWDQQSREAAGWIDVDDGVFYIQIEDFVTNFQRVYLCRLTDDIYPHHQACVGTLIHDDNIDIESIRNPQIEIGLEAAGKMLIELLLPRAAMSLLVNQLRVSLFELNASSGWNEAMSVWNHDAIIAESKPLNPKYRVANIEIELKEKKTARYVAVVTLDRRSVIKHYENKGNKRMVRRAKSNFRFTTIFRSEQACSVRRVDAACQRNSVNQREADDEINV